MYCNYLLFAAFLSSCFPTWPKSQEKILRTKRAFNMKQKAFFIIFTGFSAARNWPRPKSGSLKYFLSSMFFSELVVVCVENVMTRNSTDNCSLFQKQLPEVLSKKMYSLKFCWIQRKIPTSEFLFKKSCRPETPTQRCFAVKYTKFFRTNFLYKALRWLLLFWLWLI